jgi:hypothetical protein
LAVSKSIATTFMGLRLGGGGPIPQGRESRAGSRAAPDVVIAADDTKAA